VWLRRGGGFRESSGTGADNLAESRLERSEAAVPYTGQFKSEFAARRRLQVAISALFMSGRGGAIAKRTSGHWSPSWASLSVRG